MQARFLAPLPPKRGLSTQLMHTPQSGRVTQCLQGGRRRFCRNGFRSWKSRNSTEFIDSVSESCTDLAVGAGRSLVPHCVAQPSEWIKTSTDAASAIPKSGLTSSGGDLKTTGPSGSQRIARGGMFGFAQNGGNGATDCIANGRACPSPLGKGGGTGGARCLARLGGSREIGTCCKDSLCGNYGFRVVVARDLSSSATSASICARRPAP